jgi:hypothetical protein
MYSINTIFKHTEPTTSNTFKGEYVGGTVTLNMKTGEQGTEICLKSKDGRYKWVEISQCIKQNKSENS